MVERRLAWAAALCLFAAGTQAQNQSDRKDVQPEVIYGEDNRVDLYQVTDERLRKLMGSTVALFDADNVAMDPRSRKAKLTTRHYGQARNLCPDEPFYDQQKGAFCSGSLVGPDLVMTAGHCVTSKESCEGTKFVFGFTMAKKDSDPTVVPSAEVYGCKELVDRKQAAADWALVRLDRRVLNHEPLAVNRSGSIAKDTPLFVIGHPAGLPAKLAGGAKVRDGSQNGFFTANLDTYGGNSGSAVFNAKTGLIEGILVRGETDYESRGQCMVSKRCPDDGCRGEDVTKIGELMSQIPPLERANERFVQNVGLETSEAFRNLNELSAPKPD